MCLSSLLKLLYFVEAQIWAGSLFHTIGPCTLKDLETNVFLDVLGMVSSFFLLAECSPGLEIFFSVSSSVRYFGAIL